MKTIFVLPSLAKRHTEGYFSVAISIVVGLTVTWVLSAAGFLLGLSIARWQSISGILAALLCLVILQNGRRERWLSILSFFGVLISALLVSTIVVDKSWDGWCYHQLGVISLASGWNPVYEPLAHVWFSLNSSSLGYPSDAPLPDGVWTSFYPKASWILASQPLMWGFSVDSGKFPGMLLIVVSALVSFRYFRIREMATRWSYLLSVMVALNPVAIAQATTYYVDGLLGGCLSIVIFSLLSFDRTRNSLDLLLVICVSLIACNLKFTGPVYIFIIVFPSLLLWFLKKQMVVWHSIMLGVGLLIFAVGSVNPYFTNMRIAGSPIHPLNRVDLMQNQMAPEFLEKNRVSKLLISLTFSNLPDREVLKLSNPLQWRGGVITELHNFVTQQDLRIGGFGPVFGLALGLAFFAAALLIFRPERDIGLSLIIVSVVMSIAVNPEMWWARYVPQMWILPIIASASIIKIGKNQWVALGIVGLMGLTSIISLGGWTVSTVATSKHYRDNLNRVTENVLLVEATGRQAGFLPALAYRLRDEGVSLHISAIGCDNPIDLVWVKGCSPDSNSR